MGSLVEIAHFFDPEEAFVAQGYLRAQGISTIIQNEHHLNMAPWLRVALGGYRLLAIREIATDARAALRHLPDANELAPAQSGQVEMKESSREYVRQRNWFWTPFAFFSNAPFIPVYRSTGEMVFQMSILFCLYAGLFFAMHIVGGFWNYLFWFLM